MGLLAHSRLAECDVHQILSNPRRRETLARLKSGSGVITVSDLAEAVATAETGQEPAPRNVRESVYSSLHQTHLPMLHDLGIVCYDRERHEVELLAGARHVTTYMDVVTSYGVTWGEFYRAVGVVGLLTVVAADAGIPGVALVDPLLWGSAFLAVFALSACSQLWSNRGAIRRLFGR